VHIPRARIGHIICDYLLPRGQKTPAVDAEVVIDPEFLVRDSTGPAPAV
jgi:DNA-binding LacI/PurR family transcriptional regulator